MTPLQQRYVDAAASLLESSLDGVISTGQVAYRVYVEMGRVGRFDAHVAAAENAISCSGVVWPVMNDPCFSGVRMWRIKPADWRVA